MKVSANKYKLTYCAWCKKKTIPTASIISTGMSMVTARFLCDKHFEIAERGAECALLDYNKYKRYPCQKKK